MKERFRLEKAIQKVKEREVLNRERKKNKGVSVEKGEGLEQTKIRRRI